MRSKRFAAVLLAGIMLAGCGFWWLRYGGGAEKVIAYVPLDDRPDNEERVVYLAESLGYALAMPERDDYRTRLNEQPLNENGTQSGDRAALYEWVLAQEKAGCDRYVLSMDQLLSGGLVHSRAMAEHEAVTLSDGTVLKETELLEALLTTLAKDRNNRVWLLDSVMRLAPTVGYQHWTLTEYNALRAYGMEARPAADAETLEAVEETYRLGTDGGLLAPAQFGLQEGQVAEYLSARSRKLELSDAMLRLITENGYQNFSVLMGIDDSSAEECIQKNEIAYLKGLLREQDALLSGVDDLAFKAVAKLYLEEQNWQGAAASVEYFGGMEGQPACAYDFQPLTTIVKDHFDFFGLTEERNAPLRVLVLTQPREAAEKENYYNALIARLKTCREAGQPVILIDAGNGLYDTAFHDALTEQTELGWLLSYAGFLDMAIVTGTALSHGVARYAYLQAGKTSETAEEAFDKTLADSILKDFCYKNVVREEILAYVRGDLQGNPDNFWTPDIDRAAVQKRLEEGMAAAVPAVLENLWQSRKIVALAPYEEGPWRAFSLENYRFPWDRAFEIGMDMIFITEEE